MAGKKKQKNIEIAMRLPVFKVTVTFVPQEIMVVDAYDEGDARLKAIDRYYKTTAKMPLKDIKVTEIK